MAVEPQKIQEKLDKLRRNETQMTPEQCTFYKKNLQAFKVQIAKECEELLRAFVFGDIRTLKEDEKAQDEILGRAKKLTETAAWKKLLKEAGRILFRTYSLDKFLKAVCPLHTEIYYKAYGPYWVSKTQVDKAGDIINPIMDAIWGEKFKWSAEHNQWEGKEKLMWAVMLPPTMELLKKSYEEEVETYAGGNGKQNGG